ncbi:hypothetical protein AACH06_11885 [Ideonella sp. DXS29W]|uniref:Chorismatase FkbO/Hyg5-like N-terminal domain-containing protein n=1 Tax=Ideonella lacteola TaxID=2984193 RepID=A0ABU9BPX4_9BURK
MSALPRTSALRAQRLPDAQAGWPLARSARLLGGVAYQRLDRAAPPMMAESDLPSLSINSREIDGWLVDADVRHGQTGEVRWATDGQWLFGAYDSTLAEGEGPLDNLTERTYANIFQALETAEVPHLLRLWNYLPSINREQLGLERYRQFNLGRQQAFLNAHRDAFAGAPAACALGTFGGPMRIRFLAGRVAPVPLENPRQVPAWRYPAEFGPRSPTFSRAVLVPSSSQETTLLISGTASIVGSASVHPGDVPKQMEETLRNLEAVMGAAHERGTARYSLSDLVCTVYVRHASHIDDVKRCFEAGVGADSLAARQAIYVQADICRGDLLLEVEAHATAPGALS